MCARQIILRVAVNTPVRKLFDYLPPESADPDRLRPGVRVRVPFGKSQQKIGVLVDTSGKTELEPRRLKHVIEILDPEPVIDNQLLRFFLWASDYYHHPVGEVILGCLPRLISNGQSLVRQQDIYWKTVQTDRQACLEKLQRAPRQRSIWLYLDQYAGGLGYPELAREFGSCRNVLDALTAKGLVQTCSGNSSANRDTRHTVTVDRQISGHTLNREQQRAVDTINRAGNTYHVYLLDGVTGSGKTEVYIHAINTVLLQGRQALVLVPEIALTPQLVERFSTQLDYPITTMHSGMRDSERKKAWLDAGNNVARVILGTRSSLWIPLHKPGLISVDEEHDLSYKQQEGFRYSARDLSVIRARQLGIPVILGSATPSLESLLNCTRGRYTRLPLTRRAGAARLPQISILDTRNRDMDGALSDRMIAVIREHLDKKQQILMFLNRRGYAPVMMCHACGWICRCPRCDIQMTYHKTTGRLCCHHCQHQQAIIAECPDCKADQIIEIGHGTQRLMETLNRIFPAARVARLDRDATRKRGTLEEILNGVHRGEIDILVGTQIMAKGHHFPAVTLVGIIDADRGLFSADYRSTERLAQLITQVSGRAGRIQQTGKVIIQTHFPDHPLIRALEKQDYPLLADLLLTERKAAGLPPYSYQVLLRAEANQSGAVEKFLVMAKQELLSIDKQLDVFGPYTAPIEKKAGRYRMQLMLQSASRQAIGKCLHDWVSILEKHPGGRRVRWALDVDPQDLL